MIVLILKATFWAVRFTVAAPPDGVEVAAGEAEGDRLGLATGEVEGEGLGLAAGDATGEGVGDGVAAGVGVGVTTALPSLKAINLGVPKILPGVLAAAHGQIMVSPATAGQPLIPAFTFWVQTVAPVTRFRA